jgi:predicted metal-dependent hydrolase
MQMSSFFPTYTHLVNPKLKHTYLSFDDKGDLIIKSPPLSTAYIEQLLLKKSAWIRRSQQKIREKKGRYPDFDKNDTLFYKGRGFPFTIQQWEKKKMHLHFDGTCFILYYRSHDPEHFLKHIDSFYKQSAIEQLPSLVDKWADTMRLSYGTLHFRKTKRQWGSCSAKNDISLNTMLMKLPQKLIDYVVVHELAHIRHKHHQKSFWKTVERYLPEYQDAIAELKTYTP